MFKKPLSQAVGPANVNRDVVIVENVDATLGKRGEVISAKSRIRFEAVEKRGHLGDD